jgi:succinoglycan biosynthesis transport protein ExoP
MSRLPAAPLTPLDMPAAFDLRGFLRALWLGKWVIACCTAFSVLAAGYYGFAMAGPRHAAVSVIDLAPDAQPATEMQVILSDAMLLAVIAELHLADDPAFNRYLTPARTLSQTHLRDKAREILSGQRQASPDAAAITAKLIANLRGMVQVTRPRDTQLLRLTVTAGSPHRAITIANLLAATYLADKAAASDAAHAQRLAFVQDRLASLRADQTALENSLASLLHDSGLQDTARPDQVARQLADTDTRLTATTAALTRAGDSANRARLTAQVAALDAARTDLARQAAQLSDAALTRDRITAEIAATEAEMTDFQTHLHQVILTGAQADLPPRLLHPAREALYIGPQKLLLVQIAALVGALIGGVILLLHSMLRRGYRDAETVEQATGLPVLAQLPLLPTRRPAQMLAALDPQDGSAATEGFRHLRTALLLPAAGQRQVILSTSAIPGEGKTVQAIGLAHNLALLGKSVLLIDGDLRQGSFRRYFPLTRMDGLAAVIHGYVPLLQAVEPAPIAGVDLLAGGARDQGGADSLFLPALADVLAEARQHYDIIVIDAPPVLPVPDALALAGQADQVVFALRWDHTPAPVVAAALQRLAAADISVTGVTLTQVHARKQARTGGVSFLRYGRGYFRLT